jgi:PEP-CTERM motif
MKNLLLGAAFLAAIGASPAHATLDISFTDGANTFTCADQTSCDLDGAVKNILLINTVVGNFRIEGSFALSTFGTTDDLSTSSLTIFNSGGAGTLRMVVGDTDFTAPVTTTRESGSLTFNEGIGSAATLGFFADVTNAQPAGPTLNVPGVALLQRSGIVTSNPDSFADTANTPFVATGPFSLTETASLTMAGGSNITGFNQAIDATSGVVPEPSTWAMMGIGFALMAFMGVRRRNRFAF